MTIGVLFVCMGNICRSPTAEGVFTAMASEAGLADRLRIDSAGTHNFHPGSRPDRRSRQAASRRGYDLDGLASSVLRSGLITVQLWPRFRVRWTCWLPT